MTKTGAENNRKSDTTRRDRHRIDISIACPAHGVMKPSSVLPEWIQGTAHLVLRRRSDPAPSSE